MKGIERFIVIAAIGNMVIYVPYFLIQIFLAVTNNGGFESPEMFPWQWHVVGMFLNLLAFIVTIRDLFLRPFPNPNSKLIWCLLIVCTSGIGWFVYIFKHGLKPRTQSLPEER